MASKFPFTGSSSLFPWDDGQEDLPGNSNSRVGDPVLLAGMGVGAFERHLVQEAWAAAPGPLPQLSPETKAGLEALLKEWQ